MRAAVLALVLTAASTAQPVAPADSARRPTPRGAVTRALVAPGLGQLYNGQTLKAPVATALVAGAAAFAVYRQRRYLRYRRATVYAGCLVDDGVPDTPAQIQRNDRIRLCLEVAPDYLDEWQALGEPPFSTLSGQRDQVRGQRDIGVVVLAVAYALQALDAYVAAELSDFDVSEDLSFDVAPGAEGPRLALRLRID